MPMKVNDTTEKLLNKLKHSNKDHKSDQGHDIFKQDRLETVHIEVAYEVL